MNSLTFRIISFAFSTFLLFSCANNAPSDDKPLGIAQQEQAVPMSGTGIYVKGKGIYTCPEGNLLSLDAGFSEKLTAAEAKFMADYRPTDLIYSISYEGTQRENSFQVGTIDSLGIFSAHSSCLPYEFWCAGTEPFWDVCISEKLNLVYCADMGKISFSGPYSKPQTLPDGTKHFIIKNEKNEGIEIFIKPETCGDGMSDYKYPYRSEVRTTDRVLQGCAYTFEDSKKMAE